MKQFSLVGVFIILAATGFAAHHVAASSSTTPTISFPIAELGNCSSKADCREYCSVREHMVACTAYGKTHGLINKEQADRNEKFEQNLRLGGPGKCASLKTCAEFCKQKEHADECRAFAERLGVAPKPLLQMIASSTTSSTIGQIPEIVLRCLREKTTKEKIELFLRTKKIDSELEGRIKECKKLIEAIREKEVEDMSDASSTDLRRITPKPIEREGTSTDEGRGRGGSGSGPINPPVCTDQEACRRLCSDPQGQFFGYSDCVQFRKALRALQNLEEGDVPPNPANLPADNACPDAVTCAARCMSDDSPYFLKPECVKYREENPVGYIPSPTRVFLGNMLQAFKEFFK